MIPHLNLLLLHNMIDEVHLLLVLEHVLLYLRRMRLKRREGEGGLTSEIFLVFS